MDRRYIPPPRFITPPVTTGETVCRTLQIPDDKLWMGVFNKALLELAFPERWEQNDPTYLTADEAAAACYAIFEQYLTGYGCDIAPFWDDADAEDATGEIQEAAFAAFDVEPPAAQPWYGRILDPDGFVVDVGQWAIAAFLVYAGNPLAAIQFLTIAPKFRLLFRTRDWGGIVKIFIDGAEWAEQDTYSAEPGIAAVDVVVPGGVEGEEHTLEIVLQEEHNPAATAKDGKFWAEVVRKRLYSGEVDMITGLRQNEADSCILEFTTDGEVWVPFADLSTCVGEPGVDGADGSPGAPGADGADGADGEDGAPGAPGLDGADGATGATGATGAPGTPAITQAGTLPETESIPPGECVDYDLVLSATGQMVLPVVLQEGYTIEITALDGAGTDGRYGLDIPFPIGNITTPTVWFCPDGSGYFIGGCTASYVTDEGDPYPALHHMTILMSINGEVFDAGAGGMFTVPAGGNDVLAVFQVNDGELADNDGQYAFHVQICNPEDPEGCTPINTFDFALSEDEFVVTAWVGEHASYPALGTWLELGGDWGTGWYNENAGASNWLALKRSDICVDVNHVYITGKTDQLADVEIQLRRHSDDEQLAYVVFTELIGDWAVNSIFVGSEHIHEEGVDVYIGYVAGSGTTGVIHSLNLNLE